MSSLGDALLLSSILGSKKEKSEYDPLRTITRVEKLLKKLKGEEKKEVKKEAFGGMNHGQWTLLLFFSIPVLSVINFWVLTELMVSAVNALHSIKP